MERTPKQARDFRVWAKSNGWKWDGGGFWVHKNSVTTIRKRPLELYNAYKIRRPLQERSSCNVSYKVEKTNPMVVAIYTVDTINDGPDIWQFD